MPTIIALVVVALAAALAIRSQLKGKKNADGTEGCGGSCGGCSGCGPRDAYKRNH